MTRKTEDREEAAPHPGVVTVTMLRAIDASLHALQRLRSRFEVPAADERSGRDGGKHKQSGTQEPAAAEEAAPRPRGLLFRMTIMLICLLVGGGAGAYLSYRGLSSLIDMRTAAVERVQDELDISKKEEARAVNLMAKFQKENAEFRLQAYDAQREAGEHKARIAELEKELAAAQRVQRPAPAGRAAPDPGPSATVRPGAPPKTGHCAVGAGNPSANLSDCIEKFNQH